MRYAATEFLPNYEIWLSLTQSVISSFESGKHNPSLAILQHITEGLGKTVYVEFQ
jgi:DNA-binding helix-turn-helix protein